LGACSGNLILNIIQKVNAFLKQISTSTAANCCLWIGPNMAPIISWTLACCITALWTSFGVQKEFPLVGTWIQRNWAVGLAAGLAFRFALEIILIALHSYTFFLKFVISLFGLPLYWNGRHSRVHGSPDGTPYHLVKFSTPWPRSKGNLHGSTAAKSVAKINDVIKNYMDSD
jgi:hypothetical protein